MESIKTVQLESAVKADQIEWTPQNPSKTRPLVLYSRSAVKRTIDITGALLGLILLSPLMLLVALLVKIDDPRGPVLFRQRRIGQHSRPFEIFKFRSMVQNAEHHLKANPKLYRKYISNNYKLESDEDPRVSKIGRLLRRTSLDELPQLINVLKGEMSLVGPRPVIRDELKEYGIKSFELLSVKPGLTGYWQISGRSSVGYPERVDLELYYVHHQSLFLDIKILSKTLWAVLSKRGAY